MMNLAQVIAGIAAAALVPTLVVLIAAISLLAIFPATRLPKYAPGTLPSEDIIKETASAEVEATPAA